MRIENLRNFLVLSEKKSFSEAADTLFMTQSALSKQLGQLEKETGHKLLLRTTRRMELTPAGRALEKHARKIVREWETLRKEMEEAQEGMRKILRIGYTASEQLPFVSRGTHRPEWERLGVGISLHRIHPDQIEEAMQSREIDCAVMHRPTYGGLSGTKAFILDRCSVQAMISGRNPLSKRKSLTLAEVCRLTDVRCRESRDPLYYRAIDLEFRKAGFEPPKTIEAQESEELEGLADGPECMSLCPSIYPVWEGFVSLPVEGFHANFDFLLAAPAEGADPCVGVLAKLIRESIHP